MGKDLGFWEFLKDQFSNLPIENASLNGRTVIVTGANVGLGFEAALKFLRMKPAKLILAVRSTSKGETAARHLVEQARETKPGTVEVWELDMASFESTKAFASRVNKDLERLDIALLNAGVIKPEWETTKDGYETTLQTNVIDTGLLSVLLLPILQRTAGLPSPSGASLLKPHLVIVASDVHYWAKFPEHKASKPIAILNDRSKFNARDRYPVSKLLDVFMARKIAKLPASKDIVVGSVNPALCQSELAREAKGIQGLIFAFIKFLIARTPEVGARNYIWAALKEYPGGSFINSCRVDPVSTFADSEAGFDAEKRVWEELVEIWASVSPETSDLVTN